MGHQQPPSLECLLTTSRCGYWPQWPPWDVGYANKFVPVPGKDAFFLYKRSQSADAGPERRCRYLQDRLSARILNARIFQILTSRPDTEVSRRLPSSFLATSLFLFDREHPSMQVLEISFGARPVQSEWYQMTPFIKKSICEGK